MGATRNVTVFVPAMLASLLPYRHWWRLPSSFPMNPAAFGSGLSGLLLAAAVGIPGFIDQAHATTSLGLDAMLGEVFRNPNAGYSQGMVQGFAGLSIFTFLLLTPKGWVTMYLGGSSAVRMGAAWFDDPVGDPILTVFDQIGLWTRRRLRSRMARQSREALEGPEIPDRLVTGTAAGIPGCDFVVVVSRRKEGWDRGVVVVTQRACYRIGEPVERTVAGRLRTLYPLTEHRDLEAIRRSVRYDLPSDGR